MKKCYICDGEICEPLQCFECRKWVCYKHKGICNTHGLRLCSTHYDQHNRRVKH